MSNINCYCDLKILPLAELNPQQLLNQFFGSLHLTLVESPQLQIALSFPDYQLHSLGRTLRLFAASGRELQQLLAQRRLRSFADLLTISPPAALPDQHQHRCLRRVQVDSNPDRLRRRAMRRRQISYAQACEQIPDRSASCLRLPFLQVNSLSSGHRFRYYLDLRLASGPQAGRFNRYGLSSQATIPWF